MMNYNRSRRWARGKSSRRIFHDEQKVTIFGFYSIRGQSVVRTTNSSNSKDMMEFLDAVREENGDKTVVMILDNGPIHRAVKVREHAASLDIRFVFLPPYSPQLNPIEQIWRSIKRVISEYFIMDIELLPDFITEHFMRFSSTNSYARSWISKFYPELF